MELQQEPLSLVQPAKWRCRGQQSSITLSQQSALGAYARIHTHAQMHMHT